MPSMPAISALVIALMIASTVGQGMMRREPKRNQKVHKHGLQSQLQKVIGAVPADRLFAVEESIRPTYEAFPKNVMGQIPPQEIFPSIVRSYFAREHGWVIKGLEPPSLLTPKSTVVTEARVFQDRAPALLDVLKQIEQKEQGLSMSDVVGIIAALEEALLGESADLVKGAFHLNSIPADRNHVDEDDVRSVLESYLLLYRHGTPVNLTDITGHRFIKEHARNGTDWPSLAQFVREVIELQSTRDKKYDMSTVTRIASDATRKYGKFQESECMDMKATLTKLDKKGKGSVTLDAFHSEPAHVSYQFTETAEYLQKTGELLGDGDEGEVLVANYILGPSNCIASSKYYAVCCLNECETIQSEFEHKTQAPQTSVESIMQIMQGISTGTRSSEVIAELTEDLHGASSRHDNAVPLHSADFKAWLHKAFPAECPKPTAPEQALEEAELAVAQKWLDDQKTCTRMQPWQAFMQSTFDNFDRLVEV